MDELYDYVVIGGGIVGSALASGLAARGYGVALIERGSQKLAAQAQAEPVVECSNRLHEGSLKARNHVLGGNGHYWGGGLIRPPDLGLFECLGISPELNTRHETLANNFLHVERLLQIATPPIRTPFKMDDVEIGDCDLSEIFVLPSAARNTTLSQIEELRKNPNCRILPSADILTFNSSSDGNHRRKISSVEILHADQRLKLRSRHFVITTGIIDSNLLIQKHAKALGFLDSENECGRRLHDHFSVPIALVRTSSSRIAKNLFAPRFRNGLVVGRRFEFRCDTGWGARGFLHFTLQFDDVSPYREIKNLLLLRQQRASILKLLPTTIPLLKVAPSLFRIAIEKVVKQQLYLADELPVRATLDFESFPHPANRIFWVGDKSRLDWDISSEDEDSYLEFLGRSQKFLTELSRRFGLSITPLVDSKLAGNAIDYFHKMATDAFHLGGGLAAGLEGKSAVDENLRLSGTENVHVISAAIFNRPGVVNPTHTLLALADRFVRRAS
ncbi:MAG: hypothetical protein K9J74_04595 [Sulfuritalea sp.]|nr:hypothetical protein [Sulfuritalea sp.]